MPDGLGTAAAEMLELARSDPRRVLRDGPDLLAGADQAEEVGAQVTVLRALGEAARAAGSTEDSIDYLRSAARRADEHGLREAAAAARVTSASSLFLAGRTSDALGALTQAARGATPQMQAVVDFQRATIYSRSGRRREAAGLFDRALRLFRREGDVRFQAMTLHNLGMLSVYGGAVVDAESKLRRAQQLFRELGQDITVAYLEHSRGMAAVYRGDVVGALRRFDTAEEAIRRLGGDVAEVQVARCEVLLSAGLFTDAERLAEAAAARLGEAGERVDQVEAILVSANVAMAQGQYERAERRAEAAIRLLSDQDRPGWMAAARQVHLSALAASRPASAAMRRRADELAAELHEAGQFAPAAQVSLLAARLSLLIGDATGATARVGGLSTSAGPVEIRIGSWVGRALLREHLGNRRGVFAAARAGLAVLDDYQEAVGATDVRAGMSHHGAELAAIGLRNALASRRPRTVLRWTEVARVRNLLRRPLRPASDPALVEMLAELRRVSVELRDAAPGSLAGLLRRQTRLQNRIRRHAHRTEGSTSVAHRLDVNAMIERLGERVLVSFASSAGELWSVVVEDGRARLNRLGDADSLARAAAECRLALDRAAGAASGRSRYLARADELGADLNRRLLGEVPTDRPIVVVAGADLLGLPWGLLPGLQPNALAVAPSFRALLAADDRSPGSGVTVVAGPGLDHAAEEARRVAACYDGARRLPPARSRADSVLSAVEGAALAHLACHGVFNAEQGLFSTLSLADGDLTLLDLHNMAAPPAVIVLSACEVGRAGANAGDELMSVSGSLLALGSRAVVAATGRVPDSPAMPRIMRRLHQALAEGATVAAGLAQLRTGASSDEERAAAMSFLCFGSNLVGVTGSSTRS